MIPLLAAACAGLAAWCSLGSLGVSQTPQGLARLGMLPPLWLLPVLVVVSAGAARWGGLSSRTARPLFFSLILLLPWLPFRVPPAFLLWTGNLVLPVWGAVALAMLAARGLGAPSWWHDRRRAPRVAALLAAAFYLLSGWRLQGLLPGGDEPHYLIITQSLLRDGDLRIANNHERGDHREYFPADLKPDYLQRGVNGEIYSIHAPGLPAIIAPAFALFGYPGVVVFLAVLAAIGSALLWQAAYLLTESASASWFGWASGALTTPFLFEAFAVFPDALGATFLVFAVMSLVAANPARLAKARWLATGAALAALPWLHTRFAIIAGALGAIFVLRLAGSAEGRARLLPFLSLPVVSALAWFAFFYRVYGTISPAAPYGSYTQTAAGNILNGLPALFLDQQFGILPYAPVYGFCIAGMFSLARRRTRLAIELTAVAGSYLLSASAYHMWWGGSSAPARFASAILPLLALPGAWLWRSADRSATRAVGLALLTASVAIAIALVYTDAGRLAYNFRDGYSLAAERLSPLLDLPQGLPSFFRQTSSGAVARAAIWVVSLAVAWVALAALHRQTPDSRAALSLTTPVCLAAAIMIALTATWRIDRVRAVSPETSQVALLRDFNPRSRPVAISVAPFRVESSDWVLSQLNISTPTRRPAPPPGLLLVASGVIPAGRYALRPVKPGAAAGRVHLVIGRSARPVQTWDLATDLRAGRTTFQLPVAVGSIVVEGDDLAAQTTGGLALLPQEILPGSDAESPGFARRAERYGPAFVYFFDDGLFIEQAGFWIRGGGSGRIAAMRADGPGPLQLFVRNAPVPNDVTIEIDGSRQRLMLKAGEERTLSIPVSAGRPSAMIRVDSPAGFRPSDVDPGSDDARYLGTWIELR